MIRPTVVSLLVATLFSGCSGDLRELNRCYALGKALCGAYRIAPEDGCIDELNAACQSAHSDGTLDASEVNDCVDKVREVSGDDFDRCLGTPPSACVSALYEVRDSLSGPSYDGFGSNSCTYSYNDVCDEPNLCPPGTDTSDCSASSGGGTGDTCIFANDGECDEPDLCPPGTDTSDCGSSSGGGSCGTAPAQPSGATCPGATPLYCGGGSCCSSATPYHCAATGQCYERAEDASADCLLSTGGCLRCVPGNSGGGTGTPGSCPCTLNTSPCSPDPLAPACYCAMAAMSYCLADNATACQTDAAAARAQGDDYVRAAIQIDPSVQAAGCR